HRERLLSARPRPPRLPGHHPARSDCGRGHRDAAGGQRHRRQSSGRPRLCGGRPSPADGRLMVDAPGRIVQPQPNAMRLALRNPPFITGLAITLAIAAMAVVSFVWTPYDITHLVVANRMQGLSAAHPFGTDHFGRDILSMIMIGARNSI